jgi:acetyl esterase/lipase
MKMLLSILFSMSIISACQRIESPSTQQNVPSKTILNVPYGKDPAQRIDVYLPEGRTKTTTKSIILIHGGGWNAGRKEDFAAYIDSFKKRMPDLAIFNMEYRLFNGDNIFPTQENDIKTAIDFITSNAEQYTINKDQFSLLGASAGAHLALLQAYKYNDPHIRVVIDFFGPTDLTTMYNNPWHPMVRYALQMITGTSPDVNPNIYKQSSPVNYISRHSAATLILHGSQDQVVDVSQSKILKTALDKAGVTNELVIYKGERHGWYGKTLTASFDKIEDFLRRHMP